MTRTTSYIFRKALALFTVVIMGYSVASAQDTLKYPLQDRRGDRISNPSRNPFDLRDPANVIDSIEYDPKTKRYYIVEKVGTHYFRNPTYLTFDEYMRLMAQKQEANYFRERGNVLSDLNRKMLVPRLQVSDNFFNRIFGNGKVEIRPQGYVDILAGYQGQNIKNPTLPERARRNGNMDFNMNANLSVIGNVGDKLRLPISYNTLANFDFENQLKLDYTGKDDEIIKKVEAGNVSYTSKGSLIPSAQSLFGIKTQLQFGKLSVTGVLANQRGQSQSMTLRGGTASSTFNFSANDYEENRHFLLAQYFRNNYNTVMSRLPAVSSQVQILRMEVWVTNRNGSTTDTRSVAGFMDLAESAPFNPASPLTPLPNGLPDNNVNDLYPRLKNDPSARMPFFINSRLTAMGLTPVQDYEVTFARKLNPTEYYFNPQVGFLSLNQPLQPNDVLGVAFQYTYNGRIYQVGEFSNDVTPDTTTSAEGNRQVLFLKLLKATAQRTNLPIWDLMMKNVYALKTPDGSYLSSVQPADFDLNILYDEPSLGTKRYLPEGPRSGQPLLSLLNLDRLNNQRDPMPDGKFDYIEGFTIISQQARVIFPLLEPFGRDLEQRGFPGATPDIIQKYVFYPLYDTIKEIAKTYANLDRYYISGSAKGTSSSEIQLGAFNVPPGSVTVTSGGQILKENIDYIVDYSLGTVKIINPAILNANLPVNVQYENNAGFGIQQRNFLGLRFDYLAKNTVRESLSIGASLVRLGERPFFTKMNYNDDPIRNTMYGLDFNYRSEFPRLTRWLDKLPFYHTSEMSTINAYGEAALLQPGHPPQIGKGSSGLIYLDDFESSTSNIDLRFPLTSWSLASTPQGNGLFPESAASNDLTYGQNRAKLAWYNIEPNLQDPKGTNNPVKLGTEYFGDPRIRAVKQQEIYPAKTVDFGQSQLVTFDLSYFPQEKGPYNFDARPGSVDANGKLLNPQQRWGGLMRALDQIDFETGNVQFIEFWMQDPFIKNPGSTGGQLYFNLGNISEDVLRDGRRFFENGLPTPTIQAAVDTTTRWGKVPVNPIQVTQAFSNDPADRPYQDVGFDGQNDEDEKIKFGDYLNQLSANFGTGSGAYQKALNDVAADNFRNYRDPLYDQTNADILARYKNINSPQGNSPIATANDNTTSAFTLTPDQEDLDRDNSLNEVESYFQYRVDLTPGALVVGQNFITDKITVTPTAPGGVQENWYLFRIPVSGYQQKIGNIPDFKSIRFLRMFLTGFSDSVTFRFAELELVRNQWRNFTYEIDTTGVYNPIPANSPTSLKVLAVNVEENSKRQPVNYVIPPGIERVQQLSNNNVNLLQNEQSMSLQVCGLSNGKSRGVFKDVNLDLRQYGRLQMFVHAESVQGQTPLNDNDLNAVIRLGSDFVSNYYEVKIPLKLTAFGTAKDSLVWPSSDELNLAMDRLTQLKMRRNNTASVGIYYKETDTDGKSYAILGNPNLGQVQGIFLGVENAKALTPACTEVWFNELRLSSIDEKGGYAALGRVDIQLADLGTLSVAGSIKTMGFGALEQRANDRQRDTRTQVDVATNLELGKLLPSKAGISIPVYAGLTQTVSTPEYDPYDLDIKLKDKLNAAPGSKKDSIRHNALDVLTIKTVNFTNVRKLNTTGKRQRLWSVENIDLSYSYTKQEHTNPLIENEEIVKHRGVVGYNYTAMPRYWQPFRRIIRSGSPWYGLIKDFNLNPNPSLLSFRADVNRQFGAFRPRNVGGPKFGIPETFDKYFTFDRYYNTRWDISRSLNLDFAAVNRARVDEDSGRLDKTERERLRKNFFKGGRNTSYNQTIGFTYTLPLSKIPLLDWTTVRASYVARYNWLAASLDTFARSLGNFISNGQEKTLTGELDLTRLYGKSKFLRALDWDAVSRPSALPPGFRRGMDTTADGRPRKLKRDPNQLPEINTALKVVGRIITSLKRVSINYSEIGTTNLAGYLDSTQFFGMNFRHGFAPGLGFVLGRQPDTNYINRYAQKGLLTHNTLFNTLNTQTYNQRLSITAQLLPVRDLTIDLNLDKTFGKTYSELFKDTLGNADHVRLNPYTAGSFSISYISYQTLFDKFKPDEVSATFKQFEANRVILSQRLAKLNPYAAGAPVDAQGYAQGYSRYAQDVLIPAFLAAYTNKDPNKVPLIKQSNANIRSNPFSGILPRPNWRITYSGITRIPGLEKIFTNVTITHGYNSTLSMNSFNSALLFNDPLRLSYPSFIDSVSGNYVPYFLVPNISIMEAFAPLIGFDMQLVSQLNTRFEYKKSRQLSLSLIDYQLSESRSTEFTVGAGYRKRGVKLPFRLPGSRRGGQVSNDVNFQLDVSLRDDAISNSNLDQDAALPTGGQKVVLISPSIDYVLNNRVNLKLYFDQRRVEPKISTSPPITTTRAGVQIRISLAQ